jgi:HSP20 family protein
MTRQRPWHSLDLFRTQMDDLFDRFFSGALAPFDEGRDQMRVWDFGVTENDKEIIVRAEMPGFEEKDLDVRLDDNVLTIKAEKEQKGEGQEEFRSFQRSITLPQGIDAEKVQATYRNGVLELHIPRPRGSQAKRIPIQAQRTR